jgi:hypothetical protein
VEKDKDAQKGENRKKRERLLDIRQVLHIHQRF